MLSRYETNSANTEKTEYYAFLSELDTITGFEKHRLKDSAGGYPVYGYSIGDADKPTIIIDGSIHNYHEWKSAHAAMELMRVLSDPSLWAAESELIYRLLDKYRFYFIPVVSPDTYVTGLRPNANGVALDYNFPHEKWSPETDGVNPGTGGTAPFSEPETQNIRDVVLNSNTFVYINLHTYGSSSYLIMARSNVNQSASTSLHAAISETTTIYSDYNKPPFFTRANRGSSSYNWVGQQDGIYTDKMIGVVLEHGSSLPLPENKNIAIHSIFTFIYKVDAAIFKEGGGDTGGNFYFDSTYYNRLYV